MTNYAATLVALVPNANISYTGVDVEYESITWLDERTQPTKEECDAAWPQVEHDIAVKAIERKRKFRYEEETDGMFFDAQRNGGDLTAWNAAVDAIKAELPYPAAISE